MWKWGLGSKVNPTIVEKATGNAERHNLLKYAVNVTPADENCLRLFFVYVGEMVIYMLDAHTNMYTQT